MSATTPLKELTEQEKRYKENEKTLAANLLKNKPAGLKGLIFVLQQIMQAQDQGLIPRVKHEKSKLMGLMKMGITVKLSKE